MEAREPSIFEKVKRCSYLHVDLDALEHNLNTLKSRCEFKGIGVIAAVKGGAYGHGSVVVCRHLKKLGVERLAVATLDEAVHLRKNHIKGPIHIFGNAKTYDMEVCMKYSLIPTIHCKDAIIGMKIAMKDRPGPNVDYEVDLPLGSVNIKIDTGMGRNGCHPSDLPEVWKMATKLEVPVDGMFTHFADSWGNLPSTQEQLNTFMEAVEPYRNYGIRLHVSNSGAVLNQIGTDLNFSFIRPGIALYGLPPHDNDERFQQFGLRPMASVKAQPSLVKLCEEGTPISYGGFYKVQAATEWIATFPIGYADGVTRHLSRPATEGADFRGYMLREATGELCPIVGNVCMDALMARLPSPPIPDEVFSLLSASHCELTSAPAIARATGTNAYEIVTRLSARLARVYEYQKEDGTTHQTIIKALSCMSY